MLFAGLGVCSLNLQLTVFSFHFPGTIINEISVITSMAGVGEKYLSSDINSTLCTGISLQYPS